MSTLSFAEIFKIGLVLVMFVHLGCQSVKMEKEPLEIVQKAFFVSTSFGTTITICLKEGNTLNTDSVYFRSRKTAFQISDTTTNTYTGYFDNLPKDLVMSDDVNQEFKNQLVEGTESNFPFRLNDNECVIRYRKGQKPHYFKVQNLKNEYFSK